MVKEALIEIYESTSYFIGLTMETEVLFNVIPLLIAAVIILVYYERYSDEARGWSSYLSNSLVLLFVSVALFRSLYFLNDRGFQNYIDYPYKTISIVLLLLIGINLLKFNFEHLLPEKFARYLNSPLTVHLGAYAVILLVYARLETIFVPLISLIMYILILSILLNAIKPLLKRFFTYVEKEKQKDQLKDAKESIFKISELKKELNFREKKQIKMKLKRVEEKKKEAIKVKKILRKKKL